MSEIKALDELRGIAKQMDEVAAMQSERGFSPWAIKIANALSHLEAEIAERNDNPAPEKVVSCESADVTPEKRTKTEHDVVEPNSNLLEPDSQDKLYEDANSLCVELWDSDALSGWNTANMLKRRIIELLDRQAAITERELCGRCSPYATAKDYMDTIDSLTAERDELNAKLKEAEEDIRDLDIEGHVLADKLAVAEDMLFVVMEGGEPNYDEWEWNHDGLSDWFQENFTETVPQLEAERDELREELEAYNDFEKAEFVIPLDEAMKFTTDPPGYIKKHIAELQAERDRLQRVVRIQADSFLKIERENRELQDACGELERTIESIRGME